MATFSMASTQQQPAMSEDNALCAWVLIVEDHPGGRESLRLLLELFGFRVEEAADGLEGVAKGLSLRPAAAVVDIGLPGLDGYEVARRLRSGLGEQALLIAHTAYDNPDSRRRASEAGFDTLLGKPADIGEMVRLLKGVVREDSPA